MAMEVELFGTPHLRQRKAFLWDLMRENLVLTDGSWKDFEIRRLLSGEAEVWETQNDR
jgi:hypothetical protein